MPNTQEGPEYIKHILTSKKHMNGEIVSSSYFPGTFHTLKTHAICIVLDCTFSKGMRESGLNQGGGLEDELVNSGTATWYGV